MKNNLFKIVISLLIMIVLVSCGEKKDNSVLIYSSAEEFRNEFIQAELNKQFPDYDITIEYLSSGNQASKIFAEGKDTACDISYDLDYGYVPKILDNYAELNYDTSVFAEDTIQFSSIILPDVRNGGCIAVNTELLKEKNLPSPTCYEDLLNPIYKDLISMPHPKSSGTGYMFVKNLVNVWGENEAFAYFDELANNILSFTSSGSGPINALVQGEVAIALAMTGQAVTELNNGSPIEILFFEEGSPFGLYGMGIIEGKQDSIAVQEVFTYMVNDLVPRERALFYPEKIYKDKDFVIENFPQNIEYADMSNNTGEEKERLLAKWQH